MQLPSHPERVEVKTLRASVVGQGRHALRAIVAHVATSLDIEVLFHTGSDAVDVVFALVTAHDVVAVLAEARGTARGKPIIAVLADDDRVLAQRSVDCGARASYSLGTPSQLLRFLLVTLAMP